MDVIFLPTALADLEHWKKSGNTIILKRIRQLIEAIQQEPFSGIGKPEKLNITIPDGGRGASMRSIVSFINAKTMPFPFMRLGIITSNRLFSASVPHKNP